MQPHPYFDLQLHDDVELAEIIGNPISERITIHEWPLSCVQRIHTAAGQTAIYKVQAPPTVEPDFYQRARSPLLVEARLLPIDGAPAALLLTDIQSPNLSELPLDTVAKLAMVDDILHQIAQIGGDLPTLADICTPEKWLAYGQATSEDLSALVAAGTFEQVNSTLIAQVTVCVQSEPISRAISGQTGLVHLDLWAENVLMVGDGYRVIDWQRPIWGPVALDRITLLESVGIDSALHIELGVRQLRTLLLIGQFAQAARRWFPAGAASYDTQIAELIAQL